MVKSTILIGWNYLFDYIAQSNYCIIEIFYRSFLKNNIETKDSWKFDKIIKENLWEFHEAWKYVHQILLIVNKEKIVNERRCWMVWKSWLYRWVIWFRSFDSVVREISKVFQRLSTLMYLALKLPYGLSLSYVVWLFLWFTGQ